MDWALFLFKKILSAIVYPVGLTLVLMIASMLATACMSKRRVGLALAVAALLVLLISSLGITGQLLLHSLEDRFERADPKVLAGNGIRFVVVLGGGIKRGALDPIEATGCDSLVRVVEGIRLWRALGDCKLVLSGGKYTDADISSAEAMAEVAMKLGVPREAMILETESWDTDDEARLLAPVLGKTPFALVTHAFHMERSLMTFRGFGLDPVPAPTDFQTKELRIYFKSFIPSAYNLSITETAVHEYLGIGWVMLKNFLRKTRSAPAAEYRIS
ncbi:MAG: ElyC/SanA/YdcF family protein [Thermodesulfobacteriota bacterium]